MIPESQIIIRLLVAAGLGLIVGYERERQDHAAGLRTHMILIIGAALAMTLSINLAYYTGLANQAGDPARLAAQVVSGIGFLGGGVIFRYGTNVRGLTTAASLWTVTMIGLAVGAGLFLSGITATIILMIILTFLNYIEDRLLPSYNRVHLLVQAAYREGLVDEVKNVICQDKREMSNLGIERNLAEKTVSLDMLVRIWKKDGIENFTEELARIPGVNQIKINE